MKSGNGFPVTTRTQWDRRIPGLFKAEFIGKVMTSLNSKVYTIWNDDESKTSCKGSQQKRNTLLREDFLNVINTRKSHEVENAGFIKDGADAS